MKFFVAFVALVAVAVASPLQKPYYSAEAELEAIIAAIQSPSTHPATAALLEQQLAQIIGGLSPIAVGPAIVAPSPIVVGPAIVESFPHLEAIIAAINSPSTDPATAALLEQQLIQIVGGSLNPIEVGPAIVDPSPSPIAVGPEIIDFPVPNPSPVIVAPTPVESSSAPLVQIILNINQAESAPIVPGPAIVPTPVLPVDPVQIVDGPAPEPIIITPVLPTPVEPVVVPEPIIIPEPVVLPPPVLPVPVDPVVIAPPVVPVEPVIVAPIIPHPVITLPDIILN